MQIIEALQKLSTPILDYIMRIITEGGDVTIAIVIGVSLFWLVDKKFAYKLMLTFLVSAGINGGIKQFTNKNRPYQDGAKAILQRTEGSSMPSGHSQNIAVISTMVTFEYKEKLWVKILFPALFILVPLSRMYLGQHYLEDVLVGMALGVIIGIGGLYLLNKFDGYEDYIGLALIPVLLILMVFFRRENQIYVAGGSLIGLSVGYFLEKRYVDYDVKAPFWQQVIKLVIGLGVAFGLKEGLKILFALVKEKSNILDAFRYMIVALWASLGAMVLFKAIFPNHSKKEIKN